MASDIAKGTALRGPNGEVAIRTGPTLAAGQFFVFDPDNGGYYAARDDLVAKIEAWTPLVEPAPVAAEPTAATTAATPPTTAPAATA